MRGYEDTDRRDIGREKSKCFEVERVVIAQLTIEKRLRTANQELNDTVLIWTKRS